MIASRATLTTIASFLGVGGVVTVVYIAASTALTAGGLPSWAASVCCYAACIPAAYYGQRRLTFRSKSSVASSFTKYVLTQLLGLALAFALPLALADLLPALLQFATVAGLVSVLNFSLLKCWAFK